MLRIGNSASHRRTPPSYTVGAPCPAMQLPEVVRVVLQHVHADNSSTATLAAAMRVNRTWFACGIILL